MSAYDDEMKLPHSFQVQTIVKVDTKILNAIGKKIFKNPEPIGFVVPKHYSKYAMKD